MTTTKTIQLNALTSAISGAYPWVTQSGYEDKIPEINPNYHVDAQRARELLLWVGLDLPLWIYGPHGSGKTTLIKQLAAVFEQPVIFDNGDPEAEKSDFNAVMGLTDGSTSTVYSALALAVKNGWWYVLNEADLIRPGVLASLNTLLDDSRCLVVPHSGEVIKPATGFRLIVTANSVGRGDVTGKHQVERQNKALMDRFFKMIVDYPTPEVEKEIISKAFPVIPAAFQEAPEVWDAVVDHYLKFANMVRAAHKGEEIDIDGGKQRVSLSETISTRALLLWIQINLNTKGKIPFAQSINYLLALDAIEAQTDKEIISSFGITCFGSVWNNGIQEQSASAAA